MAGILGLGSLNISSGTEKLVALKDRHFYVFNSGTSNWDKQTGAGVNLTDQANAEHTEFLDMQFWVNGNDATRSYDASSWSTTANVTDAPIAKYPEQPPFTNRVFLGNIKLTVGTNKLLFPSRVWYSDLPEQDTAGNYTIQWGYESGTDLASNAASAVVTSAGSSFVNQGIKAGDPFFITAGTNAKKYTVLSVDSATQVTLTENVTNTLGSQSFWCGDNYIEIRTNDSDVITGLGDNSNKLLVFKNNSLNRVTLSSQEQVKGVPGTPSHRSIINAKEFTFYFHPTGIWRYNGVTAQLISESIWDVIEAISSSNYTKVFAETDGARYVQFHVGTTSANSETDLPAVTNCVLRYDLLLDAWTIGSRLNQFTVGTNWVEGGVPKIYAGATDGQVYQLETGNAFDGAAIASRARFIRYPISPNIVVNGEWLDEFSQRGEGLQVGYRRINQPKKNDADFTPIAKAFPVDRKSFRGLEFEVIESSTDPTWELEGLSLVYSGPRYDR